MSFWFVNFLHLCFSKAPLKQQIILFFLPYLIALFQYGLIQRFIDNTFASFQLSLLTHHFSDAYKLIHLFKTHTPSFLTCPLTHPLIIFIWKFKSYKLNFIYLHSNLNLIFNPTQGSFKGVPLGWGLVEHS